MKFLLSDLLLQLAVQQQGPAQQQDSYDKMKP
jgi:hypothetical protein